MRKVLTVGVALALLTVPSAAAATSPSLALTVPVEDCAPGDWLQVTTPDGAGNYSLDGDTLTITSSLIGDGVDHRFTVQTNKPVEGCHVTGAGVLTFDGAVVDPYQRDVAPGGANLQVTWHSGETTPEEPGDDSIPWTELEPAEPTDDSIPWTELEPADPVEKSTDESDPEAPTDSSRPTKDRGKEGRELPKEDSSPQERTDTVPEPAVAEPIVVEPTFTG